VLAETIEIYEQLVLILHPFMPFITEEIWHQLKTRREGEDCVISSFPQPQPFDEQLVKKVDKARTLVATVREIRSAKGLKAKDLLEIFIQDDPSAKALFEQEGLSAMVEKMAVLQPLQWTATEVEGSLSFISDTEKYYMVLEQQIDVEEEIQRINKDLEHFRGFVQSVQKKLSNERFVAGAPADVVERERQKLADGEAKIKNLEAALVQLGK
jgi:valyl-tRNA synthetase